MDHPGAPGVPGGHNVDWIEFPNLGWVPVNRPNVGPSIYDSWSPPEDRWRPVELSIPAEVQVGSLLEVSGRCPLPTELAASVVFYSALPGKLEHALFWSDPLGASEDIAEDGSFAVDRVVTAPPGDYFVQAACASENLVSDVLYNWYDEDGVLVGGLSFYQAFWDQWMIPIRVTDPATLPVTR